MEIFSFHFFNGKAEGLGTRLIHSLCLREGGRGIIVIHVTGAANSRGEEECLMHVLCTCT